MDGNDFEKVQNLKDYDILARAIMKTSLQVITLSIS